MRCLSLAAALRERGARVSFICRELPGHLCSLIANKGYPVYRLSPPGPEAVQDRSGGILAPVDWLEGLSWQLDADQTEEVLAGIEERPSWLIVDHYGLHSSWERRMRPYVERIMVIDDVADRPHDCDALLNQNFGVDSHARYSGLVPEHCQLFLGPRFALLRPEFHDARARLRARDGTIRRILIFFGGTDCSNETGKALEAVRLLGRTDVAIDVVIGQNNLHLEELQRSYGFLPNIFFHHQVENMAELMAEADLAIGAGGTTSWERCCVGLPSVVIAIAANQEPAMAAMATEGRVLYLGRKEDVNSVGIQKVIAALLEARGWVRSLSAASIELVDGCGCLCVSRALLAPPIRLRPALPSDRDSIFEWRNAEETRHNSLTSAPITRKEHEAWFSAMLQSPERVLLVGEADGEPVGVLRYDLSGDRATVSIYLVPGKHGQGHGSHLLLEGTEWLRRFFPDVRSIIAEVLADNVISSKAFLKAGYEHYLYTYRKILNNE